MGMTITEKILAAKCNKLSVKAGELILADVDLAMANDVTAPVAIKEFEKARLDKIFNKDKVAFILDHFTPNKDINSATLCKVTREFAKKHNITHFYEGGNVGILVHDFQLHRSLQDQIQGRGGIEGIFGVCAKGQNFVGSQQFADAG